MKFLVPNFGCPQIPVLSVLCPQLNSLNPPPRKKIPGYATVVYELHQLTRIIKT